MTQTEFVKFSQARVIVIAAHSGPLESTGSPLADKRSFQERDPSTHPLEMFGSALAHEGFVVAPCDRRRRTSSEEIGELLLIE